MTLLFHKLFPCGVSKKLLQCDWTLCCPKSSPVFYRTLSLSKGCCPPPKKKQITITFIRKIPHLLENFAIPENQIWVLSYFLAFSARFFRPCPIKSCISSIHTICSDLLINICNRFVGHDSDQPKKRRKLTKDEIEHVYASAQESKLKRTVCTNWRFFYGVRTLLKSLLAHMMTRIDSSSTFR